MKYIVYLTTNLVNNKIYIGVHKTENPDVWDAYLGCGVKTTSPSSYMNPETPFQYAVKKYGCSNFRRQTLKVFDSAIDAFDLERFLVDREFIQRKDTYNACLGGCPGYRLNLLNQFDLNGNYVKTWDSILEASEFYQVSHTAIFNAIKFKYSSKNFYWSYSDKINLNDFAEHVNTPIYYVYDATTLKVINTFISLPKASKELGVSMQQLQLCVKGKFKTKNYYISNKLYDEFPVSSTINLKYCTVYVYSLNGDFITELNTTEEMCEFFKVKRTTNINRSIRAERPFKGYQLSLEKVDKMPACTDKTNKSKKVGRFSKTGELLETFDSTTAAIKKYNTSVTRCLKGQQQFCHGFIFRYL